MWVCFSFCSFWFPGDPQEHDHNLVPKCKPVSFQLSVLKLGGKLGVPVLLSNRMPKNGMANLMFSSVFKSSLPTSVCLYLVTLEPNSLFTHIVWSLYKYYCTLLGDFRAYSSLAYTYKATYPPSLLLSSFSTLSFCVLGLWDVIRNQDIAFVINNRHWVLERNLKMVYHNTWRMEEIY